MSGEWLCLTLLVSLWLLTTVQCSLLLALFSFLKLHSSAGLAVHLRSCEYAESTKINSEIRSLQKRNYLEVFGWSGKIIRLEVTQLWMVLVQKSDLNWICLQFCKSGKKRSIQSAVHEEWWRHKSVWSILHNWASLRNGQTYARGEETRIASSTESWRHRVFQQLKAAN